MESCNFLESSLLNFFRFYNLKWNVRVQHKIIYHETYFDFQAYMKKLLRTYLIESYYSIGIGIFLI